MYETRNRPQIVLFCVLSYERIYAGPFSMLPRPSKMWCSRAQESRLSVCERHCGTKVSELHSQASFHLTSAVVPRSWDRTWISYQVCLGKFHTKSPENQPRSQDFLPFLYIPIYKRKEILGTWLSENKLEIILDPVNTTLFTGSFLLLISEKTSISKSEERPWERGCNEYLKIKFAFGKMKRISVIRGEMFISETKFTS